MYICTSSGIVLRFGWFVASVEHTRMDQRPVSGGEPDGMVITYALLGMAIVSEVIGTLALRGSEGFSRPLPTALVLSTYAFAFALLSIVLKRGMTLAIAYAVWSAAGVVLVAVIGFLFLDERLSLVQVLGMALVVAGVVTLELGTHGVA